MSGTFYGIGVGPGDPDLITLKAKELIAILGVVAYPASAEGDSLARRIAGRFIVEGTQELPVMLPMSSERAPAQQAYDAAAASITALLDAGRDVGFLCEGDPLFYGSYMYLHGRVARTHHARVIPGVTSLTACAAALGAPLAGRNDVFKVLPATLEADRLRAELSSGEKAMIIKVGRHFAKVRGLLRELGLAADTMIVCAATREDEKIMALEDLGEDEQPYFSSILVNRGGEQW